MTIRLLIVDDRLVVRTGLRAMLGADPEFDVVGEATSGARAVELAGRLRPDVVLADRRRLALVASAVSRPDPRVSHGGRSHPHRPVSPIFRRDHGVGARDLVRASMDGGDRDRGGSGLAPELPRGAAGAKRDPLPTRSDSTM
jgi:DNA-binding NarL/FixJ family response regulator